MNQILQMKWHHTMEAKLVIQPTLIQLSLLDSDQDSLNCTLPTSIDAAGKLKQMLGWRTLVDDEEMSFGLLMILNKQEAHIADTKKRK